MAAVKGAVAPDIDPKSRPDGYSIGFNLDDADLPELVKAISSITDKHFIFGGKLRQIKATVHSPSKISVGEAYQAFLSILQANGMTVIQHGRFLKIVETAGAVAEGAWRWFPMPIQSPTRTAFSRGSCRLAHLDAAEAAAVLAKFKSKDGDVTVHAPGNLLILTETGTNVRHAQILEEIDTGRRAEQNLGRDPQLRRSRRAGGQARRHPRSQGQEPQRGERGRRGAGAPKGGGGTRVLADERSNNDHRPGAGLSAHLRADQAPT